MVVWLQHAQKIVTKNRKQYHECLHLILATALFFHCFQKLICGPARIVIFHIGVPVFDKVCVALSVNPTSMLLIGNGGVKSLSTVYCAAERPVPQPRAVKGLCALTGTVEGFPLLVGVETRAALALDLAHSARYVVGIFHLVLYLVGAGRRPKLGHFGL